MAGTNYTVKNTLITEVIKKVFPNTKKKITGAGLQTALLDMIESLWDRGGSGGGCEVTAISESNEFISVVGQVVVCQDSLVDIDLDIEFLPNVAGNTGQLTIYNALPQNLKNKKWFKLEKFMSVISSRDPADGIDFGSVSFNDLSSYNRGVLNTGDNTEVFLAGTSVGQLRMYDFNGDSRGDQGTPPDLNWATLDGTPTNFYSDDGENFPTAYPENSPKDLTIAPLHITIKNRAAVLASVSANAVGVVHLHLSGRLM